MYNIAVLPLLHLYAPHLSLNLNWRMSLATFFIFHRSTTVFHHHEVLCVGNVLPLLVCALIPESSS